MVSCPREFKCFMKYLLTIVNTKPIHFVHKFPVRKEICPRVFVLESHQVFVDNENTIEASRCSHKGPRACQD